MEQHFENKGAARYRPVGLKLNCVSRLEGGLVKPLPKLSFAKANENDVSMTEEQFNAAFFGAELVTV